MVTSRFSPEAVRGFFAWSETLDYVVLRPLSHIRLNWEITWDHGSALYQSEEDSFADDLNHLIEDLAQVQPPARYHDSEDRLAQYVIEGLKWPIYKQGGRWVGCDYEAILEQGGFSDVTSERFQGRTSRPGVPLK